MQTIALLLTLFSSLVILYQDFKRRQIHLFAIIVLGMSFILFRINEFRILLFHSFINFVFLVILFAILRLYFRLRKGEKKLINRYIGMGDVLIFVAFCFAYSLYNFTLFILAGCITGLLYWVIQNLVLNKKIIRIPLAGILVLVHLVITLICFKYSYDPMIDLNPILL